VTSTIIALAVYALVMALLAYTGYRRTKNTSDYLLAGKKIHPVVMALSYGATFISTSAIVGFGGAAGQFGMGLSFRGIRQKDEGDGAFARSEHHARVLRASF